MQNAIVGNADGNASAEHSAHEVFPCTWPGCCRGSANPFESAGRLANHRFAAHGIRSSNEESIARQARRDRRRALGRGAPSPEYIDVDAIAAAVRRFLPINLPREVRHGSLDHGEREQLRRRLCHLLLQWMHEYRRTPADLAVAVVQLGATGFVAPPPLVGIEASERIMHNLASLLDSHSRALQDSDASADVSVVVQRQ